MRKLITSTLLAVLVAAGVVLVSGSTLFPVTSDAGAVAEAEAGPCRCPLIYAPVVCDNGKTYPNQCVADCKHAKNCVPSGL